MEILILWCREQVKEMLGLQWVLSSDKERL